MRTPGSWAWAATVLVALTRPLLSQERQSVIADDPVLRALVAEVAERNPGLAGRRSAVKAATLRIRPAGALPDPTVSLGVMDLTLPSFAFKRSDFTEVDVEAMQEFPWPGTLSARSAVSRAAESGARADVNVLRRDLTATTATAYYRLSYLATALQTLERQRPLLDVSVQLSMTRYGTGAAPQSDPLQARLARDRLDAEEAAVQGQYATVLAAVNALRDRSSGDSVNALAFDLTTLRSDSGLPPADSLVARALRAHPRLGVRRAAVEQAARSIRVEQLAGRPDFTLTLRYGRRGSVGGVALPDFFSAFVGLRVPIWAGRKQHPLANAAREDSAVATATLRDAELELAKEITESLAGAQAERKRLDLLLDRVLPAAEATAASVRQSYQVGRAEFLTLLTTQDALYRAQLEAAAVAAEYRTHLVMLEQLVTEDQP